MFKTNSGVLSEIDAIAPGSWVQAESPVSGEIDRLCNELDAPKDFLTAALDIDERPRVEREDEFTLIVLRIPHYTNGDEPSPRITIPLGIIFTDAVVVTVTPFESEMIRSLINSSWRGHSTAKQRRFVLRLFFNTAVRYLRYLRLINREFEEIEDRLEKTQRNQEVLELLKMEKSLTYFLTALRGNEVVLNRLHRSPQFHEYPDDQELLEDVLTETRQAIEMTEIAANIHRQTMTAFSSIIDNNLNVVVKFLTAITFIVTIPTMIASFWGMNVPVPFADSRYGFLTLMGVSLGLIAAAVVWFARKRYL